MSWDELPDRTRKAREVFAISINNAKTINLWFPDNHPLSRSSCIKTKIGKGEHEGLIMLIPSSTGRRVMKTGGKTTKDPSRFLRYSTLPGAPTQLNMTEVKVASTDSTDGSVALRLPWEVKKPQTGPQAIPPAGFGVNRVGAR